MAYVRGDTTPIESSASFLPCNLSVIMKDEEKDEGLVFGIIHKHIINIGILGLDSSTQNLVSNGRLEDKNPSSHVTQVRETTNYISAALGDLLQAQLSQRQYYYCAHHRLGGARWQILGSFWFLPPIKASW